MQRDTVYSEIISLIIAISPIALREQDLAAHSSLSDDLSFDSITIVSLVTLCEEMFGINTTGQLNDLAEIDTIDETVDFIYSLVVKQTPVIEVAI